MKSHQITFFCWRKPLKPPNWTSWNLIKSPLLLAKPMKSPFNSYESTLLLVKQPWNSPWKHRNRPLGGNCHHQLPALLVMMGEGDSLSLYVYIYILHVCICIYIYISIYLSIYLSIHPSIYLYDHDYHKINAWFLPKYKKFWPISQKCKKTRRKKKTVTRYGQLLEERFMVCDVLFFCFFRGSLAFWRRLGSAAFFFLVFFWCLCFLILELSIYFTNRPMRDCSCGNIEVSQNAHSGDCLFWELAAVRVHFFSLQCVRSSAMINSKFTFTWAFGYPSKKK